MHTRYAAGTMRILQRPMVSDANAKSLSCSCRCLFPCALVPLVPASCR